MARNLYTVRRFVEKHNTAFSEQGIRWKLFNAEANGLAAAGAVVRDGRRVLIDEDAFFSWLNSKQVADHAAA